jgi:hypothetical protein
MKLTPSASSDEVKEVMKAITNNQIAVAGHL